MSRPPPQRQPVPPAARPSDHAAPLDGPLNAQHPPAFAATLEAFRDAEDRMRAKVEAFAAEIEPFGLAMRAEVEAMAREAEEVAAKMRAEVEALFGDGAGLPTGPLDGGNG